MSRRKQKTVIETPATGEVSGAVKGYLGNFIPQYPLSSKASSFYAPDSLQRFQWELESSLRQQRQMKQKSIQMPFRKKRRAITEADLIVDDQQQPDRLSQLKIGKLQKEVSQLKSELANFNKSPQIEDRLDRLLEQMIKSREADRQFFKQQRNTVQVPPPPNNIFYPPMPGYPPPQQYDPRPRSKYPDRTSSTFVPKQRGGAKSRTPRRLLRKYFFVVTFTKFLAKQAEQLAKARRSTYRKFYLQKFDSQILHMKNWLVECQGYALPVILQKQNLNLSFWLQKRQVIERQKQSLLLSLVKLGLQKMKRECTAQKVSFFSQILYNLCMTGSFMMSRFWSSFQMEHICISQFYGCVRADANLEKYMIGMVVFMKLLIFNMLLQPQKFDPANFPKSKKQLHNTMYILSSIYYRLVKQVLEQYLTEKRPKYYDLGNWLNMPQQFIVQSCEPLKFNCDYPQTDEYISGLLQGQLQILQMRIQWAQFKQKIQQIITILHRQMQKRRKDVIRTQKYKLYS